MTLCRTLVRMRSKAWLAARGSLRRDRTEFALRAKQTGGLTPPACLASGSASPFRVCCYHRYHRQVVSSPPMQRPAAPALKQQRQLRQLEHGNNSDPRTCTAVIPDSNINSLFERGRLVMIEVTTAVNAVISCVHCRPLLVLGALSACSALS